MAVALSLLYQTTALVAILKISLFSPRTLSQAYLTQRHACPCLMNTVHMIPDLLFLVLLLSRLRSEECAEKILCYSIQFNSILSQLV